MIKNKYTKSISLVLAFVMVLSVIVGVMPYNRSGATTRFKDVSSQDWFYDAVEYVVENDLMSGTSSTRFSPKKTMTRAQFVTVLYRLTGDNVQSTASAGFSDVKSTDYYYNAVNWASKNGITSGVGDNKFDPNGSVSREQMATFLARYIEKFHQGKFTASSTPSTYTDDTKISSWAKSAIYDLTAYGLINGANGNKVQPKNVLSRAEGAAVLMRVHQTVAKEENPGAEEQNKIILDKTVASSIRNAIIQYLFSKSVKSYPEATNILKEAAEQYLLNGTDPKTYLAGKDLGTINVYTFNSYTDPESFVNSLVSQKHSLVNILSNTSEVDYKNYGVAVARVGEKATVCIVTEGGNANTPSGPVSPTPVAPDPTPSDPSPVTPTPSTLPSNDEIANQIFEYIKLNVPAYGITTLPTRNSQLDAAAKLIADGKYTDVDDALKAAGFSKPYLETTSPSDPYTTISYSYWSEKFDNQTYTDIVTFFGNLLKNGSKILGVTYSGNNAGLVYTDIGISVTGSGENKTVAFVLYNSTPKEDVMSDHERAQKFVEEQLALPLNASAEQLQMLEMVNAERAKVGVYELKMLPILNEIAYARAKEYLEGREKYGPHYRPDGTRYTAIYNEYEIDQYIANAKENASYRYGGSEKTVLEAMNGLTSSESHYKIMINTTSEYIGLAKYYDAINKNTVWIQVFVKFK